MLPSSVQKHICELHEKKHRKIAGEFLIEGLKGVTEALKSSYTVLAVVVDGARRDEKDMADCISLAEQKDVGVLFAGRADISRIKTTETFPGILAVVEMKTEEDAEPFGDIVIVLDAVADPGNLGTIIRTADWFGCSDIILGPGCVEPYNDKVVRSTMGSFFRVALHESEDLERTLSELKDDGYDVQIADLHGKSVQDVPLKNKIAYVFGSESHGVQKNLLSLGTKITIPGVEGAESLNVAIAAGIVLFSNHIR